MPFRIRYTYDHIYTENAERIGILKGNLPKQIPFFYTVFHSLMEDMNSMGDGTYANLELDVLLRIYRDAQRGLQTLVATGKEILQAVDRVYG